MSYFLSLTIVQLKVLVITLMDLESSQTLLCQAFKNNDTGLPWWRSG